MKTNQTIQVVLSVALLLMTIIQVQAQVPAFPGAEGAGTQTRHGRGGKIIEVTNLNDSGPGSLREAVNTSGERIVIFKVSGVINLKSKLNIFEPYLYLAGQSAPGDGICLTGSALNVVTHDVVVRYIRVRPGDKEGEDPEDRDGIEVYPFAAMGTQYPAKSYNIVFDHCSVSWAIDENVSFYGSLFPREDVVVRDITMQWSIVSEALSDSFHPKGAHSKGILVAGGAKNISLHHNLLAHNVERHPLYKTGTNGQFINNVLYNEKGGVGMVDEDGNSKHPNQTFIDIVGNYAVEGPDTRFNTNILNVDVNYLNGQATFFVKDNISPERTSGSQDEWDAVYFNGGNINEVRVNQPHSNLNISTSSAITNFDNVLATAGCVLPRRDAIDTRIVNEVQTQTGGYVDSPDEVGGYPNYEEQVGYADIDKDGMPDAWEDEYGFNKNNASDGSQDADGDVYTNVEEFLNGTKPTVDDGGSGEDDPSDDPVDELTDGLYELHPASSPDKLLSVTESRGSGDNVELAADGNQPNQRWQLTKLENGYYRLTSRADAEQCLDAAGRGTDNGINVQTWRTNQKGQPNQEWKLVLEDADEDYYSLAPRHTEEADLAMRLDVSGNSTKAGANLQLWRSNGSQAQRFVLEKVTTTSSTSSETVTYQADGSNFANPDRGMWIVAYAAEGQDSRSPLSAEYLAGQRAQYGRTLVHCRYVIDEFRNAPLSEVFLKQFESDLQACRTAGVNMVPLFMYNHGNQYGEGLDDAPQTRVIEHLDQIKPIVQANIDLIPYWPGGFVGRWGEWHNSSNNLFGDCQGDISVGGKEIVDKMFEISAPRAVVFRTVFTMKSMIGTDPVSAAEAFSGTTRARSGFKNHYFMGFDNNAEGWCTVNRQNGNCVWECSEATIESEKNFINAQGKYTPVEAESDTSVDPETDPRHAGTEAIKELKLQRVSSCNPIYNARILNRWKTDGVYEEIERNLGYRLQLVNGTFPSTVAAGETLDASLVVRNLGYASPYNPRDCELVLRNSSTIVRLDTDLDPRFWLPEDGDADRSFSVALPDDIPAGEYEILLNLSNPSEKMNTRPEYSIRLANQGVWEPETGYNKLNTTITVTAGDTTDNEPTTELTDGAYELHPVSSPDKVVSVAGSQGSGDNVGLATDGNQASQRWLLTERAGGYYRLAPASDPDQCLDVYNWGLDNGANVQTWRANPGGQGNQEWRLTLEDEAKGHYSLVPRHAAEQGLDLRLDVSRSGAGADLQLWGGGDRPHRRFAFERVGDGIDARGSEADAAGVVAYPNPLSAGEELTVALGAYAAGATAVSVTDAGGRVVARVPTAGAGTVSVPLPGAVSGVYAVRVEGAARPITRRVVVQE